MDQFYPIKIKQSLEEPCMLVGAVQTGSQLVWPEEVSRHMASISWAGEKLYSITTTKPQKCGSL